MVMARSLEPQEMADVSVQMQSPASPGMYQGQWRMCTATGLYFGGEDRKRHATNKLSIIAFQYTYAQEQTETISQLISR